MIAIVDCSSCVTLCSAQKGEYELSFDHEEILTRVKRHWTFNRSVNVRQAYRAYLPCAVELGCRC